MKKQFATASIRSNNLTVALEQSVAEIKSQLDSIDLVVIFLAGYEPEAVDELIPSVQGQLNANCLIGCTCHALVCDTEEIEGESAVSIWAAKMPGVEVLPMHLQFERSPDGGAIVGWPDETNGDWPDNSHILLLGEPFGFPVDALLERMNEDRPGVKVVGGMASGASIPGQSRILLNDQCLTDGAVAIRLEGDIHIQTMVSQGCRPIGETFVITKSERNVIEELGGLPALIQLKKIFDTLPTREKELVQKGLHVGRVINEYQETFKYGDFLIRNVIGIDADSGSISVGDYVRTGQTIQFHIRDHETATHDLTELLRTIDSPSAQSGLLFTCNGRGMNLFPDPNHDAALISQSLSTENDAFTMAGFFAAGEIGPVTGQNFLHGFTASLITFS